MSDEIQSGLIQDVRELEAFALFAAGPRDADGTDGTGDSDGTDGTGDSDGTDGTGDSDGTDNKA